MNKKQILITETNIDRFNIEVNKRLNSGYYVIPGTLVASTSTCMGEYTSHNNNAFAVILEKNEYNLA